MSVRTVLPDSPIQPAVRDRIVAQARAHFLTHGFRGVTMDDLADELGMSKKTLYAHFTGKARLLEAVLDDKLQHVDHDLGRVARNAATDFPAALHELLAVMRRHTDEIEPPFLRDMARENPGLFASVQSRRRAILQRHFGQLLRAGLKSRRIRTDIPVELMIEILLSATDGLVTPQRLSQLDLPATTCLSAIVSIFLDGIVLNRSAKSP